MHELAIVVVREHAVLFEDGRLLLTTESDDRGLRDLVLDLFVGHAETCALSFAGHDLAVDEHVHDRLVQTHHLRPLGRDVLRANHHHPVQIGLATDVPVTHARAFQIALSRLLPAIASAGRLRSEVDDEDCDYDAKQHVDEQRP